MQGVTRIAGTALLTAVALLGAYAAPARAAESGGMVFVQTNDPMGNAVVAFDQAANGKLHVVGTFPTGGAGARASGAVVDPLASQGSLVADSAAGVVVAVNAGSDTVSVLGIDADQLHLRQVIASGGSFPVSVAVRGSLVYVLNGGGAGSVSGFTLTNGRLSAIPGSTRPLGLDNGNPPFFLSSPAQVGFTPSGTQLVVTTKTNGLVDVFSVNPTGRLSDTPTVNSIGGAPFAFTFDPAGRLALVNAADNSLGTYSIDRDGVLSQVGAPVSDGQSAACWIISVAGIELVANAGSGTLSEYRINADGTVSLINATAATGVSGAIDMAVLGGVLYAQSGGSAQVDAFAVSSTGTLSMLRSSAVPDGAGQEGIAAS